ncbi:MAG: helix-turn-helix transcriptional regulator [Chloroflexi bacterium]|nr:helix-turn-helix transcriptional regulator [Chloroflexota bacterium]
MPEAVRHAPGDDAEDTGERWTLLIVRDAFNGVRRFDDFLESLGIARNILADRLQHLVEDGILERRRYQERPDRYEYRLSQKGLDLFPILTAVREWGDRHLTTEAGPPIRVTHRTCGHDVAAAVRCPHCDEPVAARDVTVARGPGFRDDATPPRAPLWTQALRTPEA